MTPPELARILRRWSANTNRLNEAEAEELKRVFGDAKVDLVEKALDEYMNSGPSFPTIASLRGVYWRLVQEWLEKNRPRNPLDAALPNPQRPGWPCREHAPAGDYLAFVGVLAVDSRSTAERCLARYVKVGLVREEDGREIVEAAWERPAQGVERALAVKLAQERIDARLGFYRSRPAEEYVAAFSTREPGQD